VPANPPSDRPSATGAVMTLPAVEQPAPDSGPAVTLTEPPFIGLEGGPSLVFQPAVDLTRGRLLGFEALLRWFDPGGGPIPPHVLIPWAEERGVMTALNAWVLGEACAQSAQWPSDLQVAVNCSIFQLRRGEVAEAAAQALAMSGINPDRLTVEVTDTSGDAAIAADLEAMARLGIQLTLDDVTSGHDIDRRLSRDVINTMKIDGTLVAALGRAGDDSARVVDAIVAVCRPLGICTVAEAVETSDQAAMLRDLGVEVAQGYLFSPPLSARDATWMGSLNPRAIFTMGLEHDPSGGTPP